MASKLRIPQPPRPKHRFPQNERRVPLKIMRPLTLRDFVSGRGDASSNVVCLQEMSVMMACFKLNEFNQAQCSKEIQTFQSCIVENKKAWEARQEMENKGIATGEKKLSHIQVNKVLKKYPIT